MIKNHLPRVHSFFLFLALSFHFFGCKSTKNPDQKDTPLFDNIVMIIGDDHSTNVIGCYGNDIIRTPNLDRLASQAVMFTEAFANAPLCSASRQSLLTGKYPHATGVTLLFTSFTADQETLAEHLKKFGFKTGFVGKMHFNNNLPHGFDYRIESSDWKKYFSSVQQPPLPDTLQYRGPWKPFRDPIRIWMNADMLPAPVYDRFDEGTWFAGKANEFIEANKNNRFCLWIGFHEPHSPFNFPIEYAGRHKPDEVLLPAGSPEDDRWIPKIFKDLSESDRRGIITSYYNSVEYLDKNVGSIIHTLDSLGLRKKTLIIYIGDQGYLLNDHKRFEKHMMWEPAERSPLIITGGDAFDPGRNSKALTEYVDLVPTINDALGVSQMKGIQGVSLMPVLEEKTDHHKDFVFAEYLADNKAMIRTEHFKYIFTSGKHDLAQGYETGLGAPGISSRLYDLDQDPNETTNLANKPEYAGKMQELQLLMLNKFKSTHPKAHELPEGLSVEEQLVWFCEPPDLNANLDAK